MIPMKKSSLLVRKKMSSQVGSSRNQAPKRALFFQRLKCPGALALLPQLEKFSMIWALMTQQAERCSVILLTKEPTFLPMLTSS
jgi:hypothetical protein